MQLLDSQLCAHCVPRGTDYRVQLPRVHKLNLLFDTCESFSLRKNIIYGYVGDVENETFGQFY